MKEMALRVIGPPRKDAIYAGKHAITSELDWVAENSTREPRLQKQGDVEQAE